MNTSCCRENKLRYVWSTLHSKENFKAKLPGLNKFGFFNKDPHFNKENFYQTPNFHWIPCFHFFRERQQNRWIMLRCLYDSLRLLYHYHHHICRRASIVGRRPPCKSGTPIKFCRLDSACIHSEPTALTRSSVQLVDGQSILRLPILDLNLRTFRPNSHLFPGLCSDYLLNKHNYPFVSA